MVKDFLEGIFVHARPDCRELILVSALKVPHLLDGVGLNVIGPHVMFVAHQQQIDAMAPLLVRHLPVEAWAPWLGGLDVANLADEVPDIIDEPVLARIEGALVTGVREDVPEGLPRRRQALRCLIL